MDGVSKTSIYQKKKSKASIYLLAHERLKAQLMETCNGPKAQLGKIQVYIAK